MDKITLLDGGMSRELERCGATLRQPEWSALALMNEPDKVRAAHAAFIAAGSQVITANSYAVVPFHLGADVFAERGAELAARAGRLAREAAMGTSARVAGSLPPACGSYLPQTFDPVAARDILSVLVTGMAPHVDLWLAETMSSLAEARAAAEAVAGSDKPLWISFTLRDDMATDAMPEPLLRSRETVRDAVKLALDLGAGAVLFNCSMPEVMQQAIETAHEVMAGAGQVLPIGVYANAFESQDDDGAANEVISRLRADLDPNGYSLWMDRWISAGASLVGGCCGIDSPHIRTLHDHLSERL
ncbi:hypothetical protein P775_13870 [Puniceibacterium antarcticum]|uniref:Hcy-binding domain-containing protein n=1 Tax=Puniceibacterium antarcticum TaxID=1206336 RepID=A0A2G8RDI1_9RHOB|nr:homocysteine S-methyltransferase family protein [Puniceibacterium antarcticum]PIL19607.1 hypothetical protein P775_13870 [Puniceibacterium antarcticum]